VHTSPGHCFDSCRKNIAETALDTHEIEKAEGRIIVVEKQITSDFSSASSRAPSRDGAEAIFGMNSRLVARGEADEKSDVDCFSTTMIRPSAFSISCVSSAVSAIFLRQESKQ